VSRQYDEWRCLGIDQDGDEDPGYWRATQSQAEDDACDLAGADPAFDHIIIQRRHTTHTDAVAVRRLATIGDQQPPEPGA
jgi:hypothetical protein